MVAIKTFLLNLPGINNIKSLKSNANIVAYYLKKKIGSLKTKPMTFIAIRNSNYIKNILIPFLDNLT